MPGLAGIFVGWWVAWTIEIWSAKDCEVVAGSGFARAAFTLKRGLAERISRLHAGFAERIS